ncbi:hypothetical protein [Alkalihalobacillus sp. TS-13]|nr:hypothetical protein [Alkalihalobacillus sp. TS-13]
MKAKAAMFHEKGDQFKVEDVELSEPKDNEVLVKTSLRESVTRMRWRRST